MSLGDRLGRLLFIVPYVAHRDGVPLAELASKLGVSTRQIEADLNLLTMVGRPPLTPDHLVDLYVEDEVVYVELDQNLSRPLSLTHEEARALVLAAKLVGDLGGVGEQLDSTVERLIAHLNPVDAQAVIDSSKRIRLAGGDTGHPATRLRDALDTHREVRIDYYSVSSDRQKSYRLRPIALLSHTGVEYLVALDVDAELQEKLFRTDRMAAVDLLTTIFEPPAQLGLEKFRTPTLYSGAEDVYATVRFSAAVARVVHERFADDQVEPGNDGSITVRMPTSSPAWLARWVLPFATDAEILAPAAQRAAIGALCREAASAYGR